MSKTVCTSCFRHCALADGEIGFCRARTARNGSVICSNYGDFTSIACDPIEKKPLARFFPGRSILSVGSYGCNLRCPFCQNYRISQADRDESYLRHLEPEELLELAQSMDGNLGVAFTYNEPLVSWEYIRDAGILFHEAGLQIVVVSNGTASLPVLQQIMPYVDAMNLDYKGDASFYRSLSGSEEEVRNTISYVYDKCHLEVTTLIVPGQNDSPAFLEEEVEFLAALSPDIPLHITRYFPRWKADAPATPHETLYRLKAVAERHLNYVYLGNV